MSSLTAQSFLKRFKRFITRTGLPQKIVSDNGQTFKSAAKTIKAITNHPEVIRQLANVKVGWIFYVERALWWGRLFERMVRSTKRCLSKMIGRAKLSSEELITLLTEVEMIINCRPLSFISQDDLEEPLTLYHLLVRRRLMSLPDHLCQIDEEDYDPEAISPNVLSRCLKFLHTTLDRFWSI